MSHKSSTALRYTGTGADFVGFAYLQGVDLASPAHLLETRTSTRSPFARDEFCETCGSRPVDPKQCIRNMGWRFGYGDTGSPQSGNFALG